MWMWGENTYGELGNNTLYDYEYPNKVNNDVWKDFQIGRFHTLAVRSDGTLWAWGLNNYGQIGDGTNTNRLVPTQIGTDTNWSSVMTAEYASFAIKTNGELWAWGINANYTLGLGNNIDRKIPNKVGTDTNWKKLSGGYSHVIALKTDGTLWGWGLNSSGQVGTGNSFVTVPTKVGTDNNWRDISTNYISSYGIKNDNTLWGWGDNFSGQMGNGVSGSGSGSKVFVPTQIGTSADWKIIKGGGYQAVAIKNDNTLWGWGSNGLSQLGSHFGNSVFSTPNKLGQDADWKNIYPGYAATYAEKSNNTMWVAGDQCCGEMGAGLTYGKHYPFKMITTYCAESVLSAADLPAKPDTISFYPNPVQDLLTISLDKTLETVTVHEMSGKQIREYRNINNTTFTIDFAGLLPASYIISIKTNNQLKSVKVIKQ